MLSVSLPPVLEKKIIFFCFLNFLFWITERERRRQQGTRRTTILAKTIRPEESRLRNSKWNIQADNLERI